MDPKDVILKIVSVGAIVLAVYIALLGIHQVPLIASIYYIISAIIVIAALIVIFAKVEFLTK
ncbi:MAG: hypothetical protein QXI38_03515 [Conexivisphaerales archaeon]